MIPKSLPWDLIRGWKPVFGKDHAHAISTHIRTVSSRPRVMRSLTRKLNMFNYCLAQVRRMERGMGSERSRRAAARLPSRLPQRGACVSVARLHRQMRNACRTSSLVGHPNQRRERSHDRNAAGVAWPADGAGDGLADAAADHPCALL